MVNTIKKKRFILFIIVALILSLNISIIYGADSLVFDDAMLFTEEERRNLEARASSLSEQYHMDILIVTTDNAMGKTSRKYADDYFDYGGFGVGENYDGILFLLDMDNREAYISTSGIGIRYLTDERIESVLDMVFDGGLLEGDYYGAALGFLNGTEQFLKRGIPSNQYNEPEKVNIPNRITVLDGIVSVVGGIFAGGIFFFTVKSKYKGKNPGSSYSYRDNSIVNLIGNENQLINSFITHRRIPKPSNNSGSSAGKSTTHRSSSGRSHGGGGRKF